MITAILAAVAMCFSDLFGVVMVMSEAGARGWLAGICDTLGYYVTLGCNWISIDALNGHNEAKKGWVLLLVGLANMFATRYATLLGKKLLERFPNPLDPRIEAYVDARIAAALEAGHA